MNYKDPNNILLIICGSMGIAVLALLLRYIFIALGFDDFGANTVFIIALVVGVILFISYLELISHIANKIFKKKQNLTIVESSEQVQTEPMIQKEEEKSNLESIREEHRQKEEERKRQLLEATLQYTQKTFAPYTSDENITTICQAVTDYFKGIEIRVEKSVSVKELSNGDLFHFGWNIWNRLQPVRKSKLEDIAIFLKVVFEKQLKDVEIDTVRKKLTFNEGKYRIKLEK